MQTLLLSYSHNNNKKRSTTSFAKRCSIISAFFLTMVFSSAAYCHRLATDEVDQCRIRVGSEKIHVTAYTPTFTQTEGYCRFIPNVGLTNLIFDYEGKKLRDVAIEFEVTKEPEGTRIFYMAPQKAKTGTVKADIDFSKFGAGDYLAHITVFHDGEQQDSHLPFVVGQEEDKSSWRTYLYMLIATIILIIVGITYLSKRQAKAENQDTE